MSIKSNRTCIICNKKYRYCNSCSSDIDKPTWYHIFDGENCRDIYGLCVAYRDKLIDIAEAYEKISELDISNLDNFALPTKLQINEILNYKETILTEIADKTDIKGNTKNKSSKTVNTKNKKQENNVSDLK